MDADDDKLAVLVRPVVKHDKGDKRVRRPLLEELRIEVVARELVRRPANEVARMGVSWILSSRLSLAMEARSAARHCVSIQSAGNERAAVVKSATCLASIQGCSGAGEVMVEA